MCFPKLDYNAPYLKKSSVQQFCSFSDFLSIYNPMRVIMRRNIKHGQADFFQSIKTVGIQKAPDWVKPVEIFVQGICPCQARYRFDKTRAISVHFFER